MINELLGLLNVESLNSNDEALAFSNSIEDYLSEHMDAMNEENPELAYFLEDELLEVCEPMEPGMNGDSLLEGVKRIRLEALKMLNQANQ